MLYALSITMFACLAGLVSALIAGLAGGIPMPAAFLMSIGASLIGWACACLIDRREQNKR